MSPITCENKRILEHTQSTTQLADGQYRVSISWCKGLSGSKYLEKGYIRKIGLTESTYMPKWCCRSKMQWDFLERCNTPGPKLQQELFDVLLRLRKLPAALVCDISEMYLQIRLHPSDRSFHRILWRKLESNQKPTVYEVDRLVFGLNCSPFLAQLVARHHATLYQQKYPMASETVLKSTYMDDSMDSVINDNQAIQLYQQLSKLWEEAGMQTHKWLSNSETVLSRIPPR